MKKKAQICRKMWSRKDEKYLVKLWAHHISALRSQKRNGHVYERMALEMEEAGIEATQQEIRVKLHNLQCRYRKEQNLITAGGTASSWPLFAKVHNILAKLQNNNLELMAEESISIKDFDQLLPSSSEHLTSSAASSSPGVESMDENSSNISSQCVFTEILRRLDRADAENAKQNKLMLRNDKRMLAIEQRRNDLLAEFVKDAKEMKNAFVDYLQNCKS